jgi:hypothetical protein
MARRGINIGSVSTALAETAKWRRNEMHRNGGIAGGVVKMWRGVNTLAGIAKNRNQSNGINGNQAVANGVT